MKLKARLLGYDSGVRYFSEDRAEPRLTPGMISTRAWRPDMSM